MNHNKQLEILDQVKILPGGVSSNAKRYVGQKGTILDLSYSDGTYCILRLEDGTITSGGLYIYEVSYVGHKGLPSWL